MGLEVSHDCWDGGYIGFHRFRVELAAAAGIGFDNKTESWTFNREEITLEHPIFVFILHSDCDGEIEAKDCGPIADAMESLLPKLPVTTREDPRHGTFAAERWVKGLRKAAAAGEAVEFS